MPSVSRPPRPLGGEAGISLIEVVFAMTLFLIVAAGVGALLTSAIASHGLARERTLAQQLAQQQIEEIRGLPYDDVGTTSGNPPGVVAPSQPIAVTGLAGTLTTQIRYVNDPTPNSYSATAHYKRVIVTVLRGRDSKQLIRAVTFIAPPNGAPFGGITNAAINVEVTDEGNNTPIEDATVDLATGPSAPRSDVTEDDGIVSFSGLTANPATGPQSYYDVTASALGYTTLREYLPPAADARISLTPGETRNTQIRLYRAATIYVRLEDALGTLFVEPTVVSVGSSRGSEEFTVTTGTLTVTQIDGELLVPNLAYTVGAQASARRPALDWTATAETKTVPDAYPTDLDSSFVLTLRPAVTSTLNVLVRSATGPVPGARVAVQGGPLPAYVTARANAGGSALIEVPPGPGYTVTATNPSRTETGSATATALPVGTVPVTVMISTAGP